MKAIYDPETDTLTLIMRDDPVIESDEIREGIIIDYNREGQAISIEMLDASEHITEPLGFVYEVRPTQQVQA
ncbi:MAG: DUF2283 domain-containing protein [Chloroflexota bacterium]|nr:DUF2283 domain-containing protein [Chloroflexota bacterium]